MDIAFYHAMLDCSSEWTTPALAGFPRICLANDRCVYHLLIVTPRSAPLIPALALVAAGCIHAFPPVATPGPVDPRRATAPVAPGHGRLYVDVVDGPTEVRVVKPVTVETLINDEVVETETLEVQSVCTSPCALDLPLGRHALAFPMRGSGGVDVTDVLVSPSPSLYRRALGWRRSGGPGFALGVLGATFGGISFATGAALLPVGLVKDSHGMALAGEITLGTGALLIAAGIWAIVNHPLMEQAGAGAQYALPGGDADR